MAIKKAVPGWKLFDKKTSDALGIPQNATKITIVASMEGAVEVHVVFIAESDGVEKMAERIARYVLVEQEDEKETENATKR